MVKERSWIIWILLSSRYSHTIGNTKFSFISTILIAEKFTSVFQENVKFCRSHRLQNKRNRTKTWNANLAWRSSKYLLAKVVHLRKRNFANRLRFMSASSRIQISYLHKANVIVEFCLVQIVTVDVLNNWLTSNVGSLYDCVTIPLIKINNVVRRKVAIWREFAQRMRSLIPFLSLGWNFGW